VADSFLAAEKELLMSCDKTLELYYLILSLPVMIKQVAEQKIEAGLNKFQPTEEESHPNYKFVDNRLIALLDEDADIKGFCAVRGLTWAENIPFVKKLFREISEKDYYQEYMSSGVSSFKEDVKLVCRIFEEELEDSEDLESILEDMNLYWTDDLAFVLNMILKKLYSLRERDRIAHPGVFLKDEDRDYAVRLLNVSMMRYGEYRDLIAKYVHNWETERLASTDVTLIVMGVAEAVYFPNIPLKVTINEYVELSKYYSTPNSRVFVNGILDKILSALVENGTIQKSGRGLVGSAE
jgi:N utilization substance protein B